jgi:hypothetical protein
LHRTCTHFHHSITSRYAQTANLLTRSPFQMLRLKVKAGHDTASPLKNGVNAAVEIAQGSVSSYDQGLTCCAYTHLTVGGAGWRSVAKEICCLDTLSCQHSALVLYGYITTRKRRLKPLLQHFNISRIIHPAPKPRYFEYPNTQKPL